MAIVFLKDSTLEDIGGAIREKLGEETKYKPGEMPEAIGRITGGGSGVELPELTNPATSDKIIEGFEAVDGDGNKITGSHVCDVGVELPELVNPAVSGDIAEGLEAIDKNGNKITGSVDVPRAKNLGADARSFSNGKIVLSRNNPADFLLRAGRYMAVSDNAENFGNAAAYDVVKGKTFTSAAGLKVEGTHECETLADMTADATANAEDVAAGKTVYVNGEKITGTHECSTDYMEEDEMIDLTGYTKVFDLPNTNGKSLDSSVEYVAVVGAPAVYGTNTVFEFHAGEKKKDDEGNYSGCSNALSVPIPSGKVVCVKFKGYACAEVYPRTETCAHGTVYKKNN